MFENLDPAQKKALLYGAPVVAALAAGTLLSRKNKPATPAPSGGTPAVMPSTAVDAGQLASFENDLTHALSSVQQSIAQLTDSSSQLPPPPPSAPPPSSSGTPAAVPLPVSSPSGLGTYAGRVAFWQAEDPAFALATGAPVSAQGLANSAQADANLAATRAAALALQASRGQ